MRLWKRRTPVRDWEIKVTTPEGTLLDLATVQLEAVWRFGDRTNDGFIDLLEMPRLHLWVKPVGWTEPDRSAAMDGTGALRRDTRWA